MTNEERDVISQFIARVGGAGVQPSTFGSVPSTSQTPALPPVDREADGFIADLFSKYPEARYRITQLAFVQEHALAAAQSRIAELQNALTQARQAQQAQAPGQPGSPWGGQPDQSQQPRGFFGSLFGGGSPPPPPPRPQYAPPPQQYAPPPQQYAPQMPPQMMQPQGTGFLGGALRTAAGVAGGVVAGEALMNLFSGGHGGGMFGGGVNPVAGPTTIIEEVPGGGASPWGAPPAGADPFDQGGALKDDGSDKFGGGGVVDNTAWDNAPSQDDSGGGWTDTSGQDSGSWDDTSNNDPI